MQKKELTAFDLTTIILCFEAGTGFQRSLEHATANYKLKKM
jgi:hypothetical protein